MEHTGAKGEGLTMARVAMVDPAPIAKSAPDPETLAAAIRSLAHLVRVSGTVLHRLVPSPLAGDLVDLIDRRLRDIEASLGAAE